MEPWVPYRSNKTFMAKHTAYEFNNEAQDRLASFESNKNTQENDKYWEWLLDDAGKTDFSPEAHQRVHEAKAYHEHRVEMEARPDDYQPLGDGFEREWATAIAENEARDAAQAEKADRIQARIAADPKLRRLQMLAESTNELGAQDASTDADRDIRQQQVYAAKRDKFDELLVEYDASSDLSFDEKSEIYDHLVGLIFATQKAPTSPATSEKNTPVAETNKETSEDTPLYDELASRHLRDMEDTADANRDTVTAADEAHLALLDATDNALAADAEHLRLLDEDDNQREADTAHLDLLNAADGVRSDEHEQTPANEALAADEEHAALLNAADAEPNEALVADEAHLAMLDAADAQPQAEEEQYVLAHPVTRRERLLAAWNRTTERFNSKRTTQSDKRTAAAVAVAVIATAVAVVGHRFGWFHGIGLDPNLLPPSGNGPSTPPPETPPTPEQPPTHTPEVPPVAANPLEIYAPAFNIPQGSGGEDLMRRLNVSPTEWYSKVAPGLAEKYPHDFYTQNVGSFVDVRFSHPGPLSKDIEQDILQRLGKI